MEALDAFIWLAIILIGIFVEAFSAGLVVIWFVLGAMVALIAEFLGANIVVQVILAVVVTTACLILTKPFVQRIKTKNIAKTNADRLLGQEAIVTVASGETLGSARVELLGSDWSAFCEDGTKLRVGDKVMIKSIEGVKLSVIVKRG